MWGKEKKQKASDEAFRKGEAAEKTRQERILEAKQKEHEKVVENEVKKSFSRGRYEGLREARRIIDRIDNSEDRASTVLSKARETILDRADEVYKETHDRVGGSVLPRE